MKVRSSHDSRNTLTFIRVRNLRWFHSLCYEAICKALGPLTVRVVTIPTTILLRSLVAKNHHADPCILTRIRAKVVDGT